MCADQQQWITIMVLKSKVKKFTNVCIARHVICGTVIFDVIVVFITVIYVPGAIRDKPYSETCLPDSGQSMHCARTEVMVHSFISEASEAKYKQIKERKEEERKVYFASFGGNAHGVNAISGTSTAMKPAAKLIGKDNVSKNDTGMVPIDSWCTGQELSNKGGFLRHGVRYYKGRLVVPMSGSYSVYSFVEFYELCNYDDGTPNIENKTDPIKHAIFKYSVTDDRNVELVASAQPRKIAKNKYENVYGSHISTVADLKSGDELSVQVSNVTLLKYTGDNYFGLILI